MALKILLCYISVFKSIFKPEEESSKLKMQNSSSQKSKAVWEI